MKNNRSMMNKYYSLKNRTNVFLLSLSLFLINSCAVHSKPIEPNAQIIIQHKPCIEPKPKAESIKLCFTPAQLCTKQIVQVINNAKKEIYIQAYGFTSQPIAEALVDAAKRKVIVKALFDRTSSTTRGSKVHLLITNGIEVSICKVPGIAHNKVMIIDKEIVITGSYNFTQAADTRNAENVLIIQNSNIAKAYLQNWFNLQAR